MSFSFSIFFLLHVSILSHLELINFPVICFPLFERKKLITLKSFLEKLSKVEFARMTGSGSAIVAYFNSDKKCKEAEKKVKKQFRNYWCKTSKTI